MTAFRTRTLTSGKTDTVPLEWIRGMDAELAQLCRNGGALRLRLGMALAALEKQRGDREMGFSSLEAYALERAGRSSRWVQVSRKLAVTLEKLPLIQGALFSGRIGWSMAALIAERICEEDEPVWADIAERWTVREMKWLIFGPRAPFTEDPMGSIATPAEHPAESPDSVASRTLTITADREDVWLFECSRMIVGQIAGHHVTMDDVVTALVAEGSTTLSPYVPENAHRDDLEHEHAAQRAWEAQLAQWREDAEAICEPRFKPSGPATHTEIEGAEICPVGFVEGNPVGSVKGSIEEIDGEIRKIASELATRDLAIGRLAEEFWQADGWRTLGYASGAQYARERLGMSLSSIKEKRFLTRRCKTMPVITAALENRSLGYESARLVARVATPETAGQWVERAEERTVRHLREETDIAQMMARLSDEPSPAPPSDELVEEMQAIESCLVSGAVFVEAMTGSQPSAPAQANASDGTESSQPSAPAQANASDGAESSQPSAPAPQKAGQTSAAPPLDTVAQPLSALFRRFDRSRRASNETRSQGRVTLRLRVRDETYFDYRSLERLFQRYGPRGPRRRSFLAFLCLNLIDTWKHALSHDVAHGSIYARDCFRCKNPVCGRRGVQAHHLCFRSAGGDDSDENKASLCLACHLDGIHEGRLKASAPASNIFWEIGRVPHTFVQGRKKLRGTLFVQTGRTARR